MIDTHASTIGGWLSAVNADTAPGRVAEAQAVHFAKEASGVTTRFATFSELSNTSGHEAAHAVVACLFGLAVSDACIRADGSGAVHYGSSQADPADILMTAVTDLAGVAFELLAANPDLMRTACLAMSHDVLVARMRLELLRNEAPDLCVSADSLAKIALATVAENLPKIRRVAAALQSLGQLNGAEIRALCGAAS